MINPGARYRGQQIFAGPGVGSGLVVFTGMASGTWLNEVEPRVFGLGVQGQSYFVQDYDFKA